MKELIHAIDCVKQIKQTTNELTPDIIKVLKRAKKVEELLELKNELIELQNNYIKYQYQDFLHTTEMKELIALKKNEIKQLEEELK